MGEHIDTLARFVAETEWVDIPEAVREHAKRVLLDTVGVILAGSEQPEVGRIREQLLPHSGSGASVFARTLPASNPRIAALLNGIAGRSIELCEGHRFVSCQGAIQIAPTVLALAESRQCSGRELLSALILGYDAAVRIGSGFTPRTLAHQNGQAPMLGAVAAGARLHGLSAQETSRALRIGASLLLTPSYTNAVAGATALNVAGGMSGLIGSLAPELALAGFEAQEQAIEESLSQLVGDGFEPAGILDGLGQRWEIQRNYFRLRACCNPIYAALDALEALLADWHPRAEDIERIDVATYQFAAAMRQTDPPNTFAARYSLPHAAAAIVLRGHAGYRSFTEEVVQDPVIIALRRRVHVTADPDLTALTPRLKPARVTVTLKNGRHQTQSCESAQGDFQDPYPEADLRRKFRDLAGLALSPEGVRMAESLLDRMDQQPALPACIDTMRSYSL